MFRRFFVVTSLVLVSASPALAADGDRAAADALFRDARQAIARGDYETACPKLEASLELDAATGTLLNLSVCDERDGDILGAIARLESALAMMKPTDDRIAFARARIAELKKRAAAPAATPTPSPTQTPSSDATQAPILDPEASKARVVPLRTISYVVISVGAASIATGLVLGGLAYDKKKTALAHCDASRVCDEEGFAAASSFHSLSTASSVAVIGGTLVAALGVVLYVTGKPSSRRAAIAPSVGPNGGGLTAWGTF
jgi:hypothetical protein